MGAAAFDLSLTFHQEVCCNCGMPFAIISDFRDRRLNDHQNFYCPAGHAQHFIGKSEAQKLREELAAEKARHQATLARKNEAEAAAARLTKSQARLKKRIKAGVCPCCKRTFSQLARHMQCKHPDYNEEKK